MPQAWGQAPSCIPHSLLLRTPGGGTTVSPLPQTEARQADVGSEARMANNYTCFRNLPMFLPAPTAGLQVSLNLKKGFGSGATTLLSCPWRPLNTLPHAGFSTTDPCLQCLSLSSRPSKPHTSPKTPFTQLNPPLDSAGGLHAPN